LVHGEVQDSYEAYGQDDWNETRPSLKALPARPLKGTFRSTHMDITKNKWGEGYYELWFLVSPRIPFALPIIHK
jgi:hypothetical protein